MGPGREQRGRVGYPESGTQLARPICYLSSILLKSILMTYKQRYLDTVEVRDSSSLGPTIESVV